jgi:excisionase family DNA binding protein
MSVTDAGKLAYSMAEAGQAIGRSRSTIYELVHQGKLRAVRSGGRTLIPRASLEAYVDGLPEWQPPDADEVGGRDA